MSVTFSSLLFEYLYWLVFLMSYRSLALVLLLFSFCLLNEKSLKSNHIFQSDFFQGWCPGHVERTRRYSFQVVKDFHNLGYGCLFLHEHLLQEGRSYSARGQKSKMGHQGWFLLEALGENLFPCLFQLPEAISIPWLLAPNDFDLCFWPWPSSPLPYEDPSDYIAATLIIQDNLPISKLLTYLHLQSSFGHGSNQYTGSRN